MKLLKSLKDTFIRHPRFQTWNKPDATGSKIHVWWPMVIPANPMNLIVKTNVWFCYTLIQICHLSPFVIGTCDIQHANMCIRPTISVTTNFQSCLRIVLFWPCIDIRKKHTFSQLLHIKSTNFHTFSHDLETLETCEFNLWRLVF